MVVLQKSDPMVSAQQCQNMNVVSTLDISVCQRSDGNVAKSLDALEFALAQVAVFSKVSDFHMQ